MHNLKTKGWLLVALCAAGMAFSGCANGSGQSPVRVEYGRTTVSVGTLIDGTFAPRAPHYRPCTRADVIELTVGMMCSYPEGPSDVERKAYLSRQLGELEINPDTFETVFRATSLEVTFTEEVADGMVASCPDQLEQMLLAAR